MLVTAIACFSLLSLQGPDGLPASPKISYTNIGAQAGVVATDLTKASGVPITVDQQIGREVLVLSVQNAPLSEVMRRMAFATYGEWQKTPDGWRLMRTAETIRKCKQRDESRYAEELRSQLKVQLASGQRQGPFDANAANQLIDKTKGLFRKIYETDDWKDLDLKEYQSIESAAPESAAAIKLIASLDPGTLVGLRDGAGIVYASDPNRSEKPLPAAASSILDQMNQEQAVLYRELRMVARMPHNANDPLPGAAPVASRALVYVHMERSRGRARLKIQTFFLDTQNHLSGGDDQTYLLGPNKGKAQEDAVKAEFVSSSPRLLAQERSFADSFFPDQAAEVGLSPLMAEVWGFQVGEPDGLPLITRVSPEAREWLTHPEVHEPLSVTGDLLIAAAKAKGLNVVADLADDCTPGPLTRSNVKVTPDKALRSLSILMVRQDLPGWIAMAPDFPTDCWTERADREAAGRFVRMVLEQGKITLDQYVAYDNSIDYTTGALVALMDCSNVNLQSIDNDSSAGGVIDILRAVRNLSPAQRDAAARPGGITVQLFGDTARYVSEVMLAGEPIELDQEEESAPTEAGPASDTDYSKSTDAGEEQSDYDLVRMLWHAGGDDYGKPCNHLIQIAGNGVPAGSSMHIDREDDEVIFGYLDTGACHPVSPSSVASRIRTAELAEQRKAKPRPRFVGFRKGTRQSYTCTFRFPGGMKLQGSASVIAIDAHQPELAYDKLPADFRKEVDETLTKMRAPRIPSTGGGGGDGAGGGQSKPPPPPRR